MKKIMRFFILSLILISCSSYNVKINSISDIERETPENFIIQPRSGQESNLEFKEYSKYVVEILEEKGYNAAPDVSTTDIIVYLDYGVTGPEYYHYIYSSPAYGYYPYPYYSRFDFYGGLSSQHRHAFIGTRIHSGTRTYYTRFLTLTAVTKDEKREVWKTEIFSTGGSSDLRKIMPYLVVAGKNYMGTNTKKQVSVTIKEKDPLVAETIE